MDKVTKRVLFVLIIVALALPIFVGCEPEPAVDPVAAAKSAFLNALDGKAKGIDPAVAIAKLDGQDFEVEFASDIDTETIKTAANSFFNAVVGLSPTAKLKIDNKPTEYTSTNKAALKDALIEYIYGTDSTTPKDSLDPLPYSATVTYNSQSFSLSGKVTFTNIPNLGSD